MLLTGCRDTQTYTQKQSSTATGWLYFQLQDYDRAQREFESSLQSPGLKIEGKIEALYGLANVWSLRQPGVNRERAISYFEEVIKLDPHGDYGAWSAFGIARNAHVVGISRTPDYAEVQRAYQRVIDNFPGHPASEEAFLFSQIIRLLDLQEASGVAVAQSVEQFIAAHPDSPHLTMCYDILRNAMLLSKQKPDAVVAAAIAAMETTEIDPSNPRSDLAGAYWSIASTAEFAAGDFQSARQYYRKLIEEYPTDDRNFGAKLALQRMDAVEEKMRQSPSPLSSEETSPSYQMSITR